MKIKPDDFTRLSAILRETKKAFAIHDCDDYEITKVKYVWDIYHLACDYLLDRRRVEDYIFIRHLSDYLDDNHLTTAFKRILIV